MRGVQFLVDGEGRKTAVLIDLKKNAQLWEDFYDVALAGSRAKEPRESLESVKRRLRRSPKTAVMATCGVTLASSARKGLERLNEPLRSPVLRRIERLASRPRPVGCQKLEGAEDLWRIRIADYRVIYSIDDSRRIVDVSAVRHRSGAYR